MSLEASRALAFTGISAVRVEPDPWVVGAEFTVQITAPEATAAVVLLDFRPAVPKILRYFATREEETWLASGSVPADPTLVSDSVVTVRVAVTDAANQRVDQSVTVRLRPWTEVPGLEGQTEAGAAAALCAAGLVVGAVTHAASQTVPEGQVFGQDPLPGTRVAGGSAVALMVSTGPPRVTVPDLTGLSQNQAETRLEKAGLALGGLDQETNPVIPTGIVSGQDPSPGTQVAPGSAVRLILALNPASGTTSIDRSLPLSAEVASDPPRITLRWATPPAGTAVTGYSVWRKSKDSASWGPPDFLGSPVPYARFLPADTTAWTDPDPALEVGTAREYKVLQYRLGGLPSVGFLHAGIEVPLVHDRGQVLLVVDRTFSESLAAELDRLALDLVGDGWTVIRRDFARGLALSDPAYPPQVRALRDLIQTLHHASASRLRAVLLVGHLPVPYAGDFAHDWHNGWNGGVYYGNHQGAWPADVYYSALGPSWSDASVRNTSPDDDRNKNVPGDGKFDNTWLAEPLDPGTALLVGRVDLADMPAFGLTEEELLRRYWDKHHAFRHRLKEYQRRALIDFNLEPYNYNGPFRSFAAMFGAANVHANPQVDWFPTLSRITFLWAAGAGQGAFSGCDGVGTTTDFARTPAQAVFTLLYGSWFGDWDKRDSLLRAGLANEDTLTCAWLGPLLNDSFGATLHHMALGETVGYALDISHRKGRLYGESAAATLTTGGAVGTHIGLMGDPTLRLHVVAPPAALVVAQPGPEEALVLSWEPSTDASDSDFRGYHLYRGADRAGPFELLTTAGPVAGVTYPLAPGGAAHYMVRAVKLERSPAGTYLNASQGVFTTAPPGVAP